MLQDILEQAQQKSCISTLSICSVPIIWLKISLRYISHHGNNHSNPVNWPQPSLEEDFLQKKLDKGNVCMRDEAATTNG